MKQKKTLVVAGGAFVVLANAPDAPLPNWGHERYDISHSVFSTTAGVLGLILLYRIRRFSRRLESLPAPLMAAGALAWYSHLLLDSFYNHGNGIVVMWPFGEGRLNLPIPCFDLLFPDYEMVSGLKNWLTPHALKVMGVEALFYGSIFVAALGTRWSLDKKASSKTRGG